MGREQVIDVTSWDANRETLMESILTAQAKENPAFNKIVLRNANKGLVENSMGDAFWPTALPGIWKNVRTNLKQEEDDDDDDDEDDDGGKEEDGDEDEDEDEDEDGYDEDVHEMSSSQGLKCPSPLIRRPNPPKRARSS